MKIDWSGERVGCALKRNIKRAIVLTLKNLNQDYKRFVLSVTFLNQDEMRELNSRTRNIDKVTDVLSYPNFNMKPFDKIDTNDENNFMGKNIFLGDMALCLERAKEQAEEYGHSLLKEVVKLVIHSTLHLMGFDHIEDDDYVVMNHEEEKIASKF